MDPGVFIIFVFLVVVVFGRGFLKHRARFKKYKINPDPEPEAPDVSEEPPQKRRASYGAARARTRNKLK